MGKVKKWLFIIWFVWLISMLSLLSFLPKANAGDIILENDTNRTILVRVLAWVDYREPYGTVLFPKAVAEMQPGEIFETSGSVDLGSATFIEWKYNGEWDWQPSWAFREDEIAGTCYWSTKYKTCFPNDRVEVHQNK